MPVVIRIAVSLVVTRRSSTYRLVRAAPYRQSRYAGLRTPVDGVPRYGGPAARAAFTGSRTCRQGSAEPGRRGDAVSWGFRGGPTVPCTLVRQFSGRFVLHWTGFPPFPGLPL